MLQSLCNSFQINLGCRRIKATARSSPQRGKRKKEGEKERPTITRNREKHGLTDVNELQQYLCIMATYRNDVITLAVG